MATLVDYVTNLSSRIEVDELERRLDKLGWAYNDAQKRTEYPQLLDTLINTVQKRHDGYAKDSTKYVTAAGICAVPLVADLAFAIYTQGQSYIAQKEALGPLGTWVMLGVVLLTAYSALRFEYALISQTFMKRVRKNLERRLAVPQ